MRAEDFDRFDALIQGVADCYGQTLTAQGIALRFKMLTPFDYAAVERAALAIMWILPWAAFSAEYGMAFSKSLLQPPPTFGDEPYFMG